LRAAKAAKDEVAVKALRERSRKTTVSGRLLGSAPESWLPARLRTLRDGSAERLMRDPWPERRLPERSRVSSTGSPASAGTGPVKALLRARKDLRAARPEKLGSGPEKELSLRSMAVSSGAPALMSGSTGPVNLLPAMSRDPRRRDQAPKAGSEPSRALKERSRVWSWPHEAMIWLGSGPVRAWLGSLRLRSWVRLAMPAGRVPEKAEPEKSTE
jgi:hypothetical protein